MSRIATSSISRSCCVLMRPALCASRASFSGGGRSRLPTWSARKGGPVLRLSAQLPADANKHLALQRLFLPAQLIEREPAITPKADEARAQADLSARHEIP